MSITYNHCCRKKITYFVILGLIFTFFVNTAKAQENPPIPVQVQVDTNKNLNFGTFTTGNAGGTVIVDWEGRRTATGDISLLNIEQGSAALFTVTSNPGTILQIQPQASIILTGTNGGTLSLNIDSYSTGSTFITSSNSESVFVGGTLDVGNSTANPPGQYNGNFSLTFIQQ